ncbi:methyltransferase domain-containing protein, partial [candidate division KSB1 bacterium]|nr:methyltransferase domain-containing protein [candidate division KSB1 bacterium]NIR68768.1 methyltransferase domain-containing protein [candidate division KSB1 bacterium]NIS24006.1 methyltransferase domain-containing protein [candidate division KSB1 bacterium]NIT70933.1 methyltransferase domain-containing protein [candidate division KSB1 bacterium]NIU24654.1 methyltransferase domain-containing protein [candidate division KSB1 bacterium]
MAKVHRVQFPPGETNDIAQDEAYFYLREGDKKRRIRLHDYDKLYEVPGLYEQVLYDRLKCQSPSKVSEILNAAVSQTEEYVTELRVLDFGAGNGMMGEALKNYGVSRIVGVDIIDEAYKATERDRPGVYDAYYIADFSNLSKEQHEDLKSWCLNCLTTVAALGFGDIPPQAFAEAFNIIQDHGWVAFNIKETFLDNRDETGFSKLNRELILSEFLDIYYLERYRHRLSITGEPLYYYALAGRKNGNIPKGFLQSLG